MKIRRRKNAPIKETQMISLADIAFLIIFFFMLTSSFMRDRIAVALPDLPRTTKTEAPLSVVMDKESRLYINGEPVPNVEALETELKARLQDKTLPKETEVRFRCEKTLKYKDYRGVYEAISNAGGIIAVMHEVRTPTKQTGSMP